MWYKAYVKNGFWSHYTLVIEDLHFALCSFLEIYTDKVYEDDDFPKRIRFVFLGLPVGLSSYLSVGLSSILNSSTVEARATKFAAYSLNHKMASCVISWRATNI